MGQTRTPKPSPDDPAAIARALRSDSEALKVAEWWVRRRLYGLNNEESRQLYTLYMDSYRAMLDQLTSAYDPEGSPVQARRAAVLAQMEREMDRLLRESANLIDEASVNAYRQGFYGRAWALDMATTAGWKVDVPSVLPTDAIRASLLAPYIGTPWHEDLRYNFQEYTARIKRSVTTSLIMGEGMAKAQRRLRDELGVKTDRRQGFRRNFYRTLLIARTEMMRASNLGALSIYERNADILSGWEWAASLDGRTCKTCQALDSQRFSFDDVTAQPPPAGSHPGCRCTLVPVLADEDLMDRESTTPRWNYATWAAQNMIPGWEDGGLAGQRSATPGTINKA